jgi:hypothetical protein
MWVALTASGGKHGDDDGDGQGILSGDTVVLICDRSIFHFSNNVSFVSVFRRIVSAICILQQVAAIIKTENFHAF